LQYEKLFYGFLNGRNLEMLSYKTIGTYTVITSITVAIMLTFHTDFAKAKKLNERSAKQWCRIEASNALRRWKLGKGAEVVEYVQW